MKIRAKDPKQVWKEAFESSQTRRKDGLETSTISGVPVKPLYTSDDLPSRAEELPGQYPYTRGIHPTGYRGRLWTMRQFSGFATAEETNRRYKYLLGNGQTGLSVAFDMPTLMGQDSDAPTSRVAIEYCAKAVPKWNTISISGYHIREAGSTAAQELAFTLADGMAYVDACIERGMRIDDFASRLSFFFDAHIDFFEEIAKFRAARRIWARWMREKYGAQDERSWKLRFHTQTAGVSLTAQQPELNIARTALEALSAVLGGTQSLHTNAMDEVLALPTDDSARLALRTQQLIAYETGVVNTIDPLGGSYFVESLTDEIERQAEAYFKRIEELGGVIPAIDAGFFQKEIADAAFRYQRELEEKRRIMIGVNEFTVDEEAPIEILRIDPKLEAEQVARVRAVRAKRDQARATAALNGLRKAAPGSDTP